MSKKNKSWNGINGTPKFRSPWGAAAPALRFAPPEKVELDIGVFFRPEELYRDQDGDTHPFAPVSEKPIMGAMLVAPMKNSSGATADIYPLRLRQLALGERGEVKQKPTVETVEVAVAVCPDCGRVLVTGDDLVERGVSRKDARNVHAALSALGRCPECGRSGVEVENATDEDLSKLFGFRIVVRITGGNEESAFNVLPKPGFDKTWFATLDEAKAALAKARKSVEENSTLGIMVADYLDGDASMAFSVVKADGKEPSSDEGLPETGLDPLPASFEASVAIFAQTKVWRQEFSDSCFPARLPALPEFIVCVASMSEAWPAYRNAVSDDDVRECLDQIQSSTCFPFLIDSLPIATAAKKDDKGRPPEVDPTKFYFVDVDRGGDYVSAGWHIRESASTGRMTVDQFPVISQDGNTPKFLFVQKSKYSSRTVTLG